MRSRQEIEAEAEALVDDIHMCAHHNRNLIPGKERELAALRTEWKASR